MDVSETRKLVNVMAKLLDHILWIANYPVVDLYTDDAKNMIEESQSLLRELDIPLDD